jgi:DNA-binding NarL/FixJ family response regulator
MVLVEYAAAGLKAGEIAARMGNSVNVIKNYFRVIYDKLGMWNRVELALWWQSRNPRKIPRALIPEAEWKKKS